MTQGERRVQRDYCRTSAHLQGHRDAGSQGLGPGHISLPDIRRILKGITVDGSVLVLRQTAEAWGQQVPYTTSSALAHSHGRKDVIKQLGSHTHLADTSAVDRHAIPLVSSRNLWPLLAKGGHLGTDSKEEVLVWCTSDVSKNGEEGRGRQEGKSGEVGGRDSCKRLTEARRKGRRFLVADDAVQSVCDASFIDADFYTSHRPE